VQTSTALLTSIYVSLTAKEISIDINHRRSHRLHSEVEVLKAIAGGGIKFSKEDSISKGGEPRWVDIWSRPECRGSRYRSHKGLEGSWMSGLLQNLRSILGEHLNAVAYAIRFLGGFGFLGDLVVIVPRDDLRLWGGICVSN
jgi:hypothetical protein